MERIRELSELRLSKLTERELAILRLIADGWSDREIAAQLYFSETTITREGQHILNKLGARNRAQAVAEAYKRGMIS